jgi:rsbT co-antagonist protein RsbR
MSDTLAPTSYTVEVQQVPFEWQLDRGQVNFFGLPSVLFWLNPSLLHMLQPLAEEIGTPLFRLLVAYSSSLGTEADYDTMVTVLGSTFEEGFLAWGRAVSTAGWGQFELPACDAQAQRATVVVRNPWELQMHHGQATQWGCPFLLGKLIGIFSHALGANCWADERVLQIDAEQSAVEFTIYSSPTTIAAEIARLREERKQREQQHLTQEIDRVARQLQAAQAEQVRMQEQALQTQAALIAELSTPLIPITDNIVLMPLIGQMDSQRAQRVIETLLHGVATHQAAVAILDITGLPIVDTGVANILLQSAQAVRLLGTKVIITGIRPEIAQTLVGLGVDLKDMAVRGTLQSAFADAIEHTRRR